MQFIRPPHWRLYLMSNSVAINYAGNSIKLPCAYHRFYKKRRILKSFVMWKHNFMFHQKRTIINKPVISVVKLVVAILDKSLLRKDIF